MFLVESEIFMHKTKQMGKSSHVLVLYSIFAYLINLSLYANLAASNGSSELASWLFVLAITITYPAIYMAPLAIVAVLFQRVIPEQLENRLTIAIYLAPIVVINALLTIILYSDLRLYDLYGFHINTFVINLLVTPGGIESMGGGTETYFAATFLAAGMLILHFVAFYTATHLQHYVKIGRKGSIVLVAIFSTLTLSERVVYGISDSQQYAPVLEAATSIPLYNQVTFRGLARKLGFKVTRRHDIRLEKNDGELNYPLVKLEGDVPEKQYNIIWIVSESMRWDMLTPEIMPNTYRESENGWRFNRHYSGGNGTRQGLFSLFYGIYGSYWNSFLRAGRSPALLDLLQSRNYQLEMFTSADFTYPEFDQTLFVNIPESNLHQLDNSLAPWERDEVNTQAIIDIIRSRDKTSPFMTFMFYESTHARYDFPQSRVIRKPYLENLNYATMTRKSLASRVDELKNRYINASYFIDSQLALIYSVLSQEDLWENTIVMVTGDHGEEFMEKGFWGHNSGFSEEQVRTPMVLWLPGTGPRVINAATTHMDIIPTIMPLLGVTNPEENYSLGTNLGKDPARSYFVVSDWAGVAYFGDGYKFTLPFNSSLSSTNQLFSDIDEPIQNIVPFLATHRGDLDEILRNVERFRKK